MVIYCSHVQFHLTIPLAGKLKDVTVPGSRGYPFKRAQQCHEPLLLMNNFSGLFTCCERRDVDDSEGSSNAPDFPPGARGPPSSHAFCACVHPLHPHRRSAPGPHQPPRSVASASTSERTNQGRCLSPRSFQEVRLIFRKHAPGENALRLVRGAYSWVYSTQVYHVLPPARSVLSPSHTE